MKLSEFILDLKSARGAGLRIALCEVLPHRSRADTSFRYIQPPPPKVWLWNDTGNYKDCCLWEGVTCDSQSGHVVGLDLSKSSIVGGINGSSSIFRLRHVQRLSLADNYLYHSHFPYGFSNLSNSLTHLNLSKAGLVDISILESEISTLGMLVSLDISYNGGAIVDMEKLVTNLTSLRVVRLDGLNLSQGFRNHSFSLLPKTIEELSLTDCNLVVQQFPSLLHLRSLTHLLLSNNNLAWNVSGYSFLQFPHLIHLDLSSCGLSGTLPNSVFLIPNLQFLDASSNPLLAGTIPQSYSHFNNLRVLDLRNNSLRGQIPPFFASNKSKGHIFIEFQGMNYIDLSNNKITRNIPPSICDLQFLQFLDLSTNNLTGSIPSCLASLQFLGVLSIKNNKLSGMLPTNFTERCRLTTLDVNQNNLHGQVPESLSLCTGLEVVDVGKNYMTGKFPVWLEDLQYLRVLVLHSNQFGGSINSRNPIGFPVVQIFDVSSNKFVGKLPSGWFRSWNGMMKSVTNNDPDLDYMTTYSAYVYSYQTSVTLTVKGIEREYEKILTIFALLDVSDNNFGGEIPETVANLKSLQLLNLSNNHFTGHIPRSFELLSQLESLHFSSNNLSGKIPLQLTELTFLEHVTQFT
ncbi:Receptor-like protein 30 [Linum grandiflorum]